MNSINIERTKKLAWAYLMSGRKYMAMVSVITVAAFVVAKYNNMQEMTSTWVGPAWLCFAWIYTFATIDNTTSNRPSLVIFTLPASKAEKYLVTVCSTAILPLLAIVSMVGTEVIATNMQGHSVQSQLAELRPWIYATILMLSATPWAMTFHPALGTTIQIAMALGSLYVNNSVYVVLNGKIPTVEWMGGEPTKVAVLLLASIGMLCWAYQKYKKMDLTQRITSIYRI